MIAIAIATSAGTLATTGRLIRWLPEASPRRALTATIIIAALALVGDLTVIAVYTWSGIPWQPLVVLAIAASLTRIACGLVPICHATAMRQAITATRHPADSPAPTIDAQR